MNFALLQKLFSEWKFPLLEEAYHVGTAAKSQQDADDEDRYRNHMITIESRT